MQEEGRVKRPQSLLWPMVIAAAIAAPFILSIVMLGHTPDERSDRIFHLGRTFVYALALTMVEVGAAFPIRMWRKKDATNEVVREIHDGTRVRELHYGIPPKYLTAYTQPRQADPLAFPAMVSAAYRAGADDGAPAGPSYAQQWARREMPPEALDGEDDVPAPPGWDGELVQ